MLKRLMDEQATMVRLAACWVRLNINVSETKEAAEPWVGLLERAVLELGEANAGTSRVE
jgi:hypothetical protein